MKRRLLELLSDDQLALGIVCALACALAADVTITYILGNLLP